jgi:NitT/TauT family transport system substrate-binding protein
MTFTPFDSRLKTGVGRALVPAVMLIAALAIPGSALAKDQFRIAWSIYVGWMPWDYAAQSGIVKKWADKYGIEIEVVQINDYVESINQYTAGAFDGCVMTNMDALTIPAAGGVDSTALIVGDFSNGNDAVILRDKTELAEIADQKVNLVELSVSHYLLARALASVGLTERAVTVVNTSDADMVSAFASGGPTAVVTWNPLVSEILAMPNTTKVFDSSQIPGEIIDLMVVNTETLEANPALGKALVGAWYETMSIMSKDDEAGRAARAAMGKASGTDLAGYDAQLASTKMFFDPSEAVAFATSDQLPATMEEVASFSFDHGLLGEGAPDPGFIGVAFPGERYFGDNGNLKLRFDAGFMQMAADGAL